MFRSYKRGHNKSRCRICLLDHEEKDKAEEMIKQGVSLRKIARNLRISHVSVLRHKKYLTEKWELKEPLDEAYQKYIVKRIGKLTTTSLMIENEILLKLQQIQKASLSATANYILNNWLKKRDQASIRELVNDIFHHKIACGWESDRRKRLSNGVRIGITLDRYNSRELKNLIEEIDALDFKEEDGVWMHMKGDRLGTTTLTLVFPNDRYGKFTKSELINGILRMSLRQP